MELLTQSPATLGLIIMNVIVSLIALNNREIFDKNVFWVGPIQKQKEWYRFFTSAFLHVNNLHLIINMYVLFAFGRVLEKILGTTGFILLYIISLLAGNAWAYFSNRHNLNYRAAGASGATSGIILAFCLFFPFATLLLFFVIPMWSIVLAVLFLVGSYVLSKRENTIIGHEAHLGGAVAGLLVALLLRPDAWGMLLQQIAEKFG